MEDSEGSLPSLLCNEDESCLDDQYHCSKDENLDFCCVSETDSEYIEMLMQKETIFQSNDDNCWLDGEDSWLKCARVDAIRWFLDTRALFGFHFRTAYLSLIYFDRFFSRRSIDSRKHWAIRLLSVACMSLAAKMEESKVPALTEYHVDEYSFDGDVRQKMELLVLSTLEWKMTCVTPFVYLNYFAAKFCGEFRHKEMINPVGELILALMEEINVMEHRPSVIAAAAVLAACDCKLTKNILEIKINEVTSWGSLDKERVFCRYTFLREIGTLKSRTLKLIITPNLLSTHPSSVDVLNDSTVPSTAGNKRKSTYINGDRPCSLPFPKICKRDESELYPS